MKSDLKIKDAMTHVIHSVGVDQPISVAKELLQKYQIRHLPVLDGGDIVGIVSERDLQFAKGWVESAETDLLIKDVLTADPYIVDPSQKLVDVAERMAEGRYGCAIIVDNGTLVGIFTTVDACRTLASLLKNDR